MRPRLLIVDDEPAILFALSSYLERRQYEIDTAESLDEATSLLAANSYDVVMTDLRLSSCVGKAEEGLEVIRVVRETRPGARTILLTAYGSPQIEAAATALGVDIYVEKPLPLAELDRLVQAMLQLAATV